MGIVSPASSSALYMARVTPLPVGRVGAIAESGTVAGALLNNTRGVCFSHVISSGNEAVTEAADLIDFFAADPATSVVVAFLETVRSPDRFVAACERCHASGKPVIVVKAGRTEAARAAAAAHTGALAYPDRLVDAFFRHHGILRVDALEELLECAVVLDAGWRPGPRVAHVTLSGGQAELLHDASSDCRSLRLAHLEAETVERIRVAMPPYGPVANPFDAWNLVDWETSYPPCLAAIACDPNVDVLVAWSEAPAHHPTSGQGLTQRVGEAAAAAAKRAGKPVAVGTTLWGSVDAQLAGEFAAAGVPLLSGLRQATVALDRAAQYAAYTPAPAVPAMAAPALGAAPFAGMAALRLLGEAGVPIVATREAANADEAVALASEIGYPVVVKAGDPTVLHRTEVGGVALHLHDAASVRAAAERMRPPLLVQAQVSGGQELILGLQRHPDLGIFVLLGLGGIWAEIFDDVAIRKAPLRPGEGREMVQELRARPLLEGARGRPVLDIAALAEAVERLALLGARLGPALVSLDVNPLVVLPRGVVALDALVVPAG
jgi:acyl-CoA synthetase (NDP forming)